nr:MAG TPA: hypothetical protein [Caudoviricetes sp.]
MKIYQPIFYKLFIFTYYFFVTNKFKFIKKGKYNYGKFRYGKD